MQPKAKIDLNTASREDLIMIPGLGPNLSDAILRFRQERGGFQSLEDLREIEEMDDDIFEAVREYLRVGSAEEEPLHARKAPLATQPGPDGEEYLYPDLIIDEPP